jgi:hypothetical protein
MDLPSLFLIQLLVMEQMLLVLELELIFKLESLLLEELGQI